MATEAGPIPARFLLHQEGLFGLVAIIGLGLTVDDPIRSFVATGNNLLSVAIGLLAGAGLALLLWLPRKIGAFQTLESWQRVMVKNWTTADAVMVALLSGLAEEALLRSLLQPIIGLVPAALVFAVLHILPDRRLWMWPVIAVAMGLILGLLFEHYGFPAAAAAHVMINLAGLLRLCSMDDKEE